VKHRWAQRADTHHSTPEPSDNPQRPFIPMPTHDKAEIVARQTPWRDVILVCRKCSGKLDGGFGPNGEDSLPRELKRGLRSTGQRASCRVIETKCLGICPKGAVTVLAARTPGAILTVPAGTDTMTVLARLLPPA
jgi:hypothetical protein